MAELTRYPDADAFLAAAGEALYADGSPAQPDDWHCGTPNQPFTLLR